MTQNVTVITAEAEHRTALIMSVCLQICLLAFEADMEKAFAAQLSQDKVGPVGH